MRARVLCRWSQCPFKLLRSPPVHGLCSRMFSAHIGSTMRVVLGAAFLTLILGLLKPVVAFDLTRNDNVS